MASATLPRNGKPVPFDHVIGIDTHRDFHVAVVLAPNGGKLGELTIPTSSKGYEQLVSWSEQFGVRPVFAIHGTGSHGAGLCRELLDAAYDVIEVNRPDRAARRRHGKDDPVDAEAAARALLAGTATIIPKRGGDQVEMIRLLKVAKDSAIDGRTRALNQMRSLLVTAPVALRERLKGLSRSELIATCASFRHGVLDGPMAAAKRALRSLARRIRALDTELEALMNDLDALTQAACPGLRQSYGIGIDGAAVLLTTVGDNPERIRSEASFAAICGASPLEASSGNKRHHHLAELRRRIKIREVIPGKRQGSRGQRLPLIPLSFRLSRFRILARQEIDTQLLTSYRRRNTNNGAIGSRESSNQRRHPDSNWG